LSDPVESIAPKPDCWASTLLDSVKQDQIDAAARAGITPVEAQRGEALEREVKTWRRANEIVKLASAFFFQAEPSGRLKGSAG
jgi:transposase